MNADAELRERIKAHEGCRLSAYQDTKGLWTIGYGHLIRPAEMDELKGHEITQARADELFDDDLASAMVLANELCHKFGCEEMIADFDDVADTEKMEFGVIVEMCFQMGNRVQTFKKMWAALSLGRSASAAYHMLDSKWFLEDSTARARELSQIIMAAGPQD